MDKNLFRLLMDSIAKGEWVDHLKFANIVGFKAKLCGLDWTTKEQLVEILVELHKYGITEINSTGVRINDCWYDQCV